MPLPTDPLLAQQWHLNNSIAGRLDLNVFGVWNPAQGAAYTGAGVTILAIDDGFDYTHADLAPNYDEALDYDFDGANDFDPFGLDTDSHGTAVLGIIGAAANGTGVVGVAYDSALIGYRIEGLISDAWLVSIAQAIGASATNAQADVVNISQGIANDANSEFGVGYTASLFDDIETAIGTAVNDGRGELGTIIVKSAGNSRADNYDVNSDDWTNDTRQVVVAAVDQDGFVSDYSSFGAAILVSGFGTPGEVVTTDRVGAPGYDEGDVTSTFNGTSSAAPMVAGVVGLMLDANDALGWRDVQSILSVTARHVGSAVGGPSSGSEQNEWDWNAATTWNGGGMHFSNDYGYGLVDALAAVRLSETWLLGGNDAHITDNEFTNSVDMLNVLTAIPDGNPTGITFTGVTAFDDVVDRVTVTVTFAAEFMADVRIIILSPDGTSSTVINDQAGGLDFNGSWTFESQAFRGERADGIWSVQISDVANGDALTVSDILLRTYGSPTSNDRYIYTNEYSDYASIGGHVTTVNDTNGGIDTVNASAVTSGSVIRLDGIAGAIDGVLTTFVGMENAIGGDGADTIAGNLLSNLLFGMRGSDFLYGYDGTDTLNGGDGGDNLSGGLGADNHIGGNDAGIDYARYDDANYGNLTIRLDGVANVGAAAVGDTYVGIEGLVGGLGADTVVGNASTNYLFGGGSADSVYGQGGADYLNGGAGGDNLWGGAGADQHIGGDDAGVDYARYDDANWGNLTVRLDAPASNVGAVAVGDTYTGIEGLVGGLGNDTVVGNGLANYLFGGGGSDNIYGQAGADYLSGGLGTNNLWGGAGADQHVGGTGVDYARYDDANWGNLTIRLDAPSFNTGAVAVGDTYTGIEGLVGGLGNDYVFGNASNNYLFGGGGNDYIDGRAGNDYLNGGAGADRFVFATTLGATNLDSIADFVHLTDDIVLAQAIFAGIGATLDASEFQIGMANAATDRIIYNNVTGQLFYDSNGNATGGMTQFASVSAGTVLSIADFVMV
jgi:Ca2+-binding RTX toxin-like protein/subtilisin family serine protease